MHAAVTGRGRWARTVCAASASGCAASDAAEAIVPATLALAEVKAHLSQLVNRVNTQHDRVTVTVHGRPSAVLLSVDDVEALEETIAILFDSHTLHQLAASDAELARGEGETEQTLAEAVRRRRASV